MHKTIIPSLTLCLKLKDSSGSFELLEGVFAKSEKSLAVSHVNMSHIMECVSEQNNIAIVLGSPIIDDCVDRANTARRLLESDDLISAISEVNGEFLVILWDGVDKKLTVATDRYSSYPAFWAKNEEEFCLSYNYMDLAQYCVNWDDFKLRPEKAYEFFVLQRLMGQETHDNYTRFIPPATLLTFEADKHPRSQQYWRPNYKKNTSASKDELIDEFVELFSKSVDIRSRKQDGAENIGIFLSGGHDSRLVSAYTNTNSTCYTLSFKRNLEVECARKIAKSSGHNHVFCELDPEFFEKTISVSTHLSGGLYTTDHALFLADGMNPCPEIGDVYLHGHGLDFMYQGMYLHARSLKLFERDTFIKRFVPLPNNLTEHFVNKIPFRSRYNMSRIMIKDKAKSYHDSLIAQVETIEKEAKILSDSPMDQWEYMVFHYPSRHYTFSNVLSKRTFGELRTPSFDNDLYDFYLRLPFEYRLHGDILRGALYKRNLKIARIPTANHGLPAAWGPYKKTIATIARKLLRHASFGRLFHPPKGKDRTWPNRDDYFRDHPYYYKKALSSLDDKEFRLFLDFINWEALEDNKENLLREPFGGVFLVTLLSYYEFYRAVMGCKE